MIDPEMLPSTLLRDELVQRREEGCDVSAWEAAVGAVTESTSPDRIGELFDRLAALDPPADRSRQEPSDLEDIRRERGVGPRRLRLDMPEPELEDRILGAWLGRCAGCVLGKPVEAWPRARIRQYLESSGEYPLQDYMTLLAPAPPGYPPIWGGHDWGRGRFAEVPRDDDIDYTILGLHVLERFGAGFSTMNVAETWLLCLPYLEIFTAERAAFRNLINRLEPPQAAVHRNPYREWIGAAIRADAFGLAAAGMPEVAAELAFRDARLSHTKNGIYGEMFVAAMLAATFVTEDIRAMIGIGLSEIPAQSRLASAIRQVLAWSRQYETWELARDRVEQELGHIHRVHTITNMALVLLGLLYGDGDLGKSISIAVMGGWDTDSTAATVGSIIGAIRGARSLPDKWVAPLGDRLRSIVAGFDHSSLRDLAHRTLVVSRDVRKRFDDA
jgi:ADP-ribosylglycohydrolase